MNDKLSSEECMALKSQYIKLIKHWGYTVTYDLDENCEDPLYDLQLLITRVDENADVYNRKKYITFMIPFTSVLGFRTFDSMYIHGNREAQAKFSQGVRNRMLEYSMDDVVAVLLREGMHIMDVYQFKQGKGRLYLNRQIIETLCTSLNTKGSPLENPYMNKKNIAERQK